jgi:hypothetical protein
MALIANLDGISAKPVSNVVDSLRNGTSPTLLLQRSLTLSKSADKDTSAQAKKLVERLTDLAVKQLDDAQKLRSQDPVSILPRIVRLSSDFKGTPTGAKAGEMLAELKKDKAVMGELKARPALDALRKIDSALQKALDEGDPKSAEFQKTHAAILKQMQTAIKSMKKSWPEAPSTQEAIQIADFYGLSLEPKK